MNYNRNPSPDSELVQLRVPPQNIEAEQAVLGALMIAPDAIDRISLSSDDFYRRDHRLIFKAIIELAEKGQPVDPVTLGEWFDQQGIAEEVGGSAYLVDLFTTTPSASNVVAYADIVAKMSHKRSLIEVGTEIVNGGFNGLDPSEIVGTAFAGISSVSSKLDSADNEPIDLFGDYSIPEISPDWLPPGVARYAIDRAGIMGAAPSAVAMSALTCIAAAVHDRIVIQPKKNEPSWTERACLWMMIVAPPGSMKSIAQKTPAKPLRQIHNEMSFGYAAKVAEYKRAMEVAKAKEKKSISMEAKGQSMGYEEPVSSPDRPLNRQIIIEDATSAAVAELLVDNERGMLWNVDELVIWFGLHEAFKDGGMSRGMALQAFDGGPYAQARIARGMVNIPNLSYSVLGTTQPDTIRNLMNNKPDNGLIQRYIVVEIPDKEYPEDEEREIDRKATSDYEENIRRLWALQPPDGGLSVAKLSPEADAIRLEFRKWQKKQSTNRALPSMLRGHLSKWKALWPRLVLAYHCYGCVNGGYHPATHPVQASTAKRVSDLMRYFLFPQALRFYQSTLADGDDIYRAAKMASAKILADGLMHITNREMHHGTRAWRLLNAASGKKDSAWQLLLEAGWLLPGGDSKKGWSVNPRVHTLYAKRAEEERSRRMASAEANAEVHGYIRSHST